MALTKFLFRCDASPAVGMGHLRRCLTLACELKKQGASIYFLCRAADVDWVKEIKGIADNWEELDWELVPKDDADKVIHFYNTKKIDVAVIDHYRIDGAYQQQLYTSDVRWLQFDGAAQQSFCANWVLNASPAAGKRGYGQLKQRKEMGLLIGPDYALLRTEFSQYRQNVRLRDQVQKILLTFGGGDDKGMTIFCLDAIKSIDPKIERIALVSSSNPHLPDIIEYVKKSDSKNIKLFVDNHQIARYMADADIAITAGGTTTFETATMGLPALIIQIADNQSLNATAWQENGVAIDLGLFSTLKWQTLEKKTVKLIYNSNLRKSMSDKGKIMVDGLGASRVAQFLLNNG